MAHKFTLEHFKSWSETLDRRMSSAVIILEDADNTLLIKATYKTHWTFPGGAVDPGESPKEAAIRELKEETNIDVNPDDVRFGWVVTRSSRVAMSYQFIFRAPLNKSMLDNIKLEESEVDDYKIISRQDILSNNRHYSKAAEAWANNFEGGYLEQIFGSDN